MRLGLISDVHANLEALTAVLRELERAGVDRIVNLGDAVGYHANPNECLDLLRRAGAVAIAGNHDRAAIGSIEPTGFGATARRAIHWTRGVLSPEHASNLRELDVFARLDAETCIVHAALHPEPNDVYHLSNAARVAASFAKLTRGDVPARICFFGHTHLAAVHRSDGRRVESLPLDDASTRISLGDGYFLVNPGSVGQPRDRDTRAAFAIFDDRAQSVEFRRVAFDTVGARRKAEAAGLLPKERRWPLSLLGALSR